MKEYANPIVHTITFLLSSGALMTALSAGNEVENQSLENKTQIKAMVKQQEKMDERQRKILESLIRIETKLENE